jgi:hypothetical protein
MTVQNERTLRDPANDANPANITIVLPACLLYIAVLFLHLHHVLAFHYLACTFNNVWILEFAAENSRKFDLMTRQLLSHIIMVLAVR